MRISLKKISYIVYFVALASVFSLIYYAGYYYAVTFMKSDNLVTNEDAAISNPGIPSGGTAFAGKTEDNYVSLSATYVEEVYNSDTGETSKTETKMPVEYLGLDRDGIVNYLTTYVTESRDESLLNIQLVSFSPERIVIRKTVCNPDNIYSYFVISENNIIKIYNANRDSLFIDTGIDISNFEEEYKQELDKGFYIETIHDLYNYLESVTS